MTVRSQGRVQWFTGVFSVPLRARVLKCTSPLEGTSKEEYQSGYLEVGPLGSV